MFNTKPIAIPVTCTVTGRMETIYCYVSTDPQVIFVNGCDNCNGSTTCQHCQAAVYTQQKKLLDTH